MSVRRYMMTANMSKIVKYGYLYNWYVNQGTGNGSITSSNDWRVPTWYDYYYLNITLGGASIAGKKLKETGTTYWSLDNGTNVVNFNLRGSGYRNYSSGAFIFILNQTGLWTTEVNSPTSSYAYTASSNNDFFGNSQFINTTGHAIRLCRNATVAEQSLSDGTVCSPYIGNDVLQYPTIKIGTNVWLACNLAETKLRGGSDIPNVTNNATWAGLTTGAMCAYNNDITNVFI
jgi:uncharacterized protein (TIGR02145 family)